MHPIICLLCMEIYAQACIAIRSGDSLFFAVASRKNAGLKINRLIPSCRNMSVFAFHATAEELCENGVIALFRDYGLSRYSLFAQNSELEWSHIGCVNYAAFIDFATRLASWPQFNPTTTALMYYSIRWWQNVAEIMWARHNWHLTSLGRDCDAWPNPN